MYFIVHAAFVRIKLIMMMMTDQKPSWRGYTGKFACLLGRSNAPTVSSIGLPMASFGKLVKIVSRKLYFDLLTMYAGLENFH